MTNSYVVQAYGVVVLLLLILFLMAYFTINNFKSMFKRADRELNLDRTEKEE